MAKSDAAVPAAVTTEGADAARVPRSIRAGVIGVGYLGAFHAEKLAEDAGAELVAVSDIAADRRREVGGRLGVTACDDYRELLDSVEAVSIVVPTDLHYGIARTCLEHGVHVLVEKPITQTPAEAAELIELAAARGLVLQVGHLERFNPAIRALEPMLERPRFVESVRVAPFKERGTEVDVVLDLMIHDIDLIQHIVGSPIASIEAVGAAVITRKPDVANARIRFESGCIANVTAGRTSLKTERKIRIFQDTCYVSADLHQKKLTVHRRGEGVWDSETIPLTVETIDCPREDALRLEIAAFLDAVREGKPPPVPGEDGKRALETALVIVEQLEAWFRSMR
ncbi:MAG: Gfo/Idh/MocA family oxidoreductase [Gammaproteobacteria bacterium]|nr:Gfo/Idh/MocA family oxidoreductase [Gammaproteobacteria bacterium]